MNNSENKAPEQKPEIVVATQWNGNDVEFEKCTNCGALHDGDHVCNPDKMHFEHAPRPLGQVSRQVL